MTLDPSADRSLVQHIVLSEFDIDVGSCVRCAYPPGVEIPYCTPDLHLPPEALSPDGKSSQNDTKKTTTADPSAAALTMEDLFGSIDSQPSDSFRVVTTTAPSAGAAAAPPPTSSSKLSSSFLTSSQSGSAQNWDSYLAEQMLPDGAEKFQTSRTVFLLNRPAVGTAVRVPVYVFTPQTRLQQPAPAPAVSPPPIATDVAATVSASSAVNDDAEDEQWKTVQFDSRSSFPQETTGTSSSGGPFVEREEGRSARDTESVEWVRYRPKRAFPASFVTEVLCMDPLTGSMALKEKTGYLYQPTVGLTQNCADVIDEDIPEEILQFARRHDRFVRGSAWEKTMSDVVMVTNASDPAKLDHPSSASLPPAAGMGVARPPEDPSSAAAMTPLISLKSLGYRFVKLISGRDHFGLLLREGHFQTLQIVRNKSQLPLIVESPGSVVTVGANPSWSSVSHSLLFGVCAAVTKKNAAVRRGGINKSVAIIGPNPMLLLPFFSLLVETAERCCEVMGKDSSAVQQQQDLLGAAFEAINHALQASLRVPRAKFSRQLALTVCNDRGSVSFHKAQVHPFTLRHNVRVPIQPCLSTDLLLTKVGLVTLLEWFDDKLFDLLSAILTERRIVLMSKTQSATVVSESVLALGLLGSAMDPEGYVPGRVFPYASLGSLKQFQTVPGFIVGTLNPMFESQTSWWDLFVDLDQRVISYSSPVVKEAITGDRPHRQADLAFYRELRLGMLKRKSMMASSEDLELFVRTLFWDYIRTIGLLTVNRRQDDGSDAAESATEDDASSSHAVVMTSSSMFVAGGAVGRLLNLWEAPQRFRVADVTLTGIHDLWCRAFVIDKANNSAASTEWNGPLWSCPNSQLASGWPAAELALSTLRRVGSHCEETELVRLAQELLRLTSACSSGEESRLLTLCPSALGGLNPIASCVLSGSAAVRVTSLSLLRRLEETPNGKQCLTTINGLLMMAYEQASRELPALV